MKNPLLKKALPHVIAIVIFLIVSIIFCKPVLEGNVLNQHDIMGWKGMAQNAFEYKEKHGHFPLWNPNLFAGMPNYQVAMEGKSILPDMTKVLSLWMPKPINFFFVACLSFYILGLCLRARPVIAMLGALAFGFATYNPIIISVGHESKMWAIAFMPLVIAGFVSTFEKRYWLGLALSTFAIYQQIYVNHLQITYYTFIIVFAITISYLVQWIRNKDWKHIGISAAISVFALITGIAGSALTLKTTSEYAKYTMRGGKDIEITGDTVKAVKTSGLDTSYAFEYSMGKAEATTILMPKAFGERSGVGLSENSKVVKKLTDKGIDEGTAAQVATSLPKYWGGIDGAAGTAGPPYLGAVICLLALIGFVLYKNPLRWGLLAVSILSIMMAWGKYLPGFNTFLFNNLPLYNKFRAPTMAMVITQLAMPMMAILALNYLLFRDKSRELLKTDFKKILYAFGGLFLLLIGMYATLSYTSSIDKDIIANYTNKDGSTEMARVILSGIKADRKAMFAGQLLRTLGYALLVIGALYLYIRNLIKPIIVTVIFLVVSLTDLFIIGKEYLNDETYVAADSSETVFTPTPADSQILADKDPDYRVLNMSGNPFVESRTSYFHKSIGGYHPAKLRIYQDVIEKYFATGLNREVLNMLNTKYVIQADQQTNQLIAIPNPEAYGPCWLVKHVQMVPNRVEAFKAIGTSNLKDTAIVESSFSKDVVAPQGDSTSTIKLVKFDNDEIEYTANCNGPQFAVFSEIYYPVGWNAYIDGKKVNYVNTDYILRGLSIPAGQHQVKFAFEPPSVKQGNTIMFIASIVILIVLLGGLYMAWRTEKPTEA